MNKLIDIIEGIILMVCAGVYIADGIAIAEGTVNLLTVTIMAVAVFFGAAVVMDLNRREG